MKKSSVRGGKFHDFDFGNDDAADVTEDLLRLLCHTCLTENLVKIPTPSTLRAPSLPPRLRVGENGPGIISDSADEIESEELFLEKRQPCPTITFPCGPGTTMPAVGQNMRNVIANGHPTQLHRITDQIAIAKNRRDSKCLKLLKPPGKKCDEYPFASSKEGGTGAEIMAVPATENSQQGGLLRGFYRSQGIKDGDCYNVVVS